MEDKDNCILPQPHLIKTHERKNKKRRLFYSILITVVIMILEFIGGVVSKSLALISDAGHMLTHFVALGISLFAIIIAEKPPTSRKTFGYLRYEIIAALFNSLFLFALAAFIIYEAYHRISNPLEIKGMEMFIVALLGLIANVTSGLILFKVSHDDLNIRSAFVHMIGDTISSVGVVAAAVIIHFTGLKILDPILSIAIAVLIVIWGFKLFKESLNILMQGTPREVDPENVDQAILSVADVQGVHDTHVWAISSRMNVLTTHILVKDMEISKTKEIIKRINRRLSRDFSIFHTTIQFEVNNSAGTEIYSKEAGGDA